MKNSKLIFSALVCFIIGGVLSAYLTFRLSSNFFLHGYYTTVIANTSVEVEALKKLREGNTKIAMQILEEHVKGNASFLDVSSNEIPSSAKQRASEISSFVKKYTANYGVGNQE